MKKIYLGGIMGTNRKVLLAILLISSLVLGLVLQSCRQVETEPERGCSTSENDLVSSLPILRDEATAGIEVMICIPDGRSVYTVVTDEFDQDEIKQLKKTSSPFPVAALITYFQIQDEGGKVITEFDTGLILRVTFSAQAWEEASKRGGTGKPRLAYLSKKGDSWGSEWIEITEKNATIEIYKPGTNGQPEDSGLIIIRIKKMEDPAIGGC
jgi:hypothetical protein